MYTHTRYLCWGGVTTTTYLYIGQSFISVVADKNTEHTTRDEISEKMLKQINSDRWEALIKYHVPQKKNNSVNLQ